MLSLSAPTESPKEEMKDNFLLRQVYLFDVVLRFVLIQLISFAGSAAGLQEQDADLITSTSTVNLIALGAICCSFIMILVLVLISCGGCDDMGGDVSSENHPACGKQSHNFGPVVADANTTVFMSSHTMGERYDPSMIPPQNLPYSMTPGGTQGFTGYQSNTPSAPQAQAPVGSQHRPAVEPPPPSYDQVRRQESVQGYGY